MKTERGPLAVATTSMYARRRGDCVEIVLDAVPGVVDAASSAQLRRGKRTVPCSLTGSADRLVLTAARAPLTEGVWGVELAAGELTQRLDARLLVQGERPLALL